MQRADRAADPENASMANLLPRQLYSCYLTAKLSGKKKTVIKISSVQFRDEYYLIVFCFQYELLAAKFIRNSTNSRLILARLLRNW